MWVCRNMKHFAFSACGVWKVFAGIEDARAIPHIQMLCIDPGAQKSRRYFGDIRHQRRDQYKIGHDIGTRGLLEMQLILELAD